MPRGRRKLFVTFTILAVIAAALLLLLYSGMSKRNVFRTPEIKIKANNNYRETVKVVCDYDYDPYSFFDKNKRPIGFDIEFINYLANKMHVNLDLHMTDWVSAQKELNVGKADIILGLDYMPDANYTLSLPIHESSFYAFGKKRYKSVRDLYGKRLATIAGGDAYYTNYFASIRLTEYMTLYSTYVIAFKSVVEGQNDYVIVRDAVGRRISQALGHDEIRQMGPPLLTVCNCYGVRKGNTAMQKRLNSAIGEGIRDGTMNMLSDKWLGDYVRIASVYDILFMYFKEILMFLLTITLIMLFIAVIQWLRYKNEKETEHMRGDKLQKKAELDLATGVFNRVSFEDKVTELLMSQDRAAAEEKFAFFMIDADDFKEVNDSYGHAKGDECLMHIAGTLKTLFRAEDIIGRLGGDEFAVFMKHAFSDETIAAKTRAIADVLDCPFSDNNIPLSVCIGVSRAPNDGTTFAELYNKADSALYKAKRAGKGNIVVYDPSIGDHGGNVTEIDR